MAPYFTSACAWLWCIRSNRACAPSFISSTTMHRFELPLGGFCGSLDTKYWCMNRHSSCWSGWQTTLCRDVFYSMCRYPDLSGPELQDHLIKKGSTLPIIFLTGHGDIPTSVKAIKAGAEDFLTKPVTREQLLASIERAIARHERTKQQRDRVDSLRSLAGKLTPRESEVFKLVILGKMNKQIAHELGTTERTVKAHRQRVMQKLQVQSLAELVSIGERIGVLSESASEPTNESG